MRGRERSSGAREIGRLAEHTTTEFVLKIFNGRHGLSLLNNKDFLRRVETLGYVGTSSPSTRQNKACKPTALLAIGHGLWTAFGRTLVSLERVQVITRPKLCGCGAATWSSTLVYFHPDKLEHFSFSGLTFSTPYRPRIRNKRLIELPALLRTINTFRTDLSFLWKRHLGLV